MSAEGLRLPSKQSAGALSLALLAAGSFLGGCGGKHEAGQRVSGTLLTIYASAPLHGVSSVQGQAVVNGERLALEQLGDRIGRFRIVFRPLDDSTSQSGSWDPGQTSADAALASQDKTTIGYIGELNSGATAVSIPLLNLVGIPQISPSSTAVGLTSAGHGASPGEPQKYYPTGVRTFARVVPNDAIQAAAQIQLQQIEGCTSTFVLDDGEVDGEDTAATFEAAAQPTTLRVVGGQTFDAKATDYRALALTVAQSGANCVLIAADTENNAVLLTKQIAAALPKAKIFATAGLAETTYADPAQGGIPLALDPRVTITVATLGASAYPPAAAAFITAYAQRFGAPQPDAIYGYDAMSLMLDAISRATDHGRHPADRSKVRAAIFATRDRHSVLGSYSIDRNGDTTQRRYGAWRIEQGQLRFWRAIGA